MATYNPDENQDTYLDRIVHYLHKAINEAKTHSNWINPNHQYAQAISSFVRIIWANTDFRTSFDAIHQKVAYFGRLNSLSQVLLKLTCPGIPDIYQGTELWDYSLVDPDNRRPIDFAARSELLDTFKRRIAVQQRELVHELLTEDTMGEIKLYLIYQTLCFRGQNQELFSEGAYIPIQTAGSNKNHICCFQRRTHDKEVVVVVPRLCYSLMHGELTLPLGSSTWNETSIQLHSPNAVFKNILTGEQVMARESGSVLLGDVFSTIPIGLLIREE